MPKVPGINHQHAVNAFEKTGFKIARQGKHITMTNGESTPEFTTINAGMKMVCFSSYISY
jgi:predicted RNA binding protein YcfA (HicA-like mRNA interferase family)